MRNLVTSVEALNRALKHQAETAVGLSVRLSYLF